MLLAVTIKPIPKALELSIVYVLTRVTLAFGLRETTAPWTNQLHDSSGCIVIGLSKIQKCF